jgi:hypothetical protein
MPVRRREEFDTHRIISKVNREAHVEHLQINLKWLHMLRKDFHATAAFRMFTEFHEFCEEGEGVRLAARETEFIGS